MKKTRQLPGDKERAMHAHVVQQPQAGWPMVQRKLYGWLERVPSSATMLVLVAQDVPEVVLLEVPVEEAVEIGREQLSGRIYLQASEYAGEMARNIRFRVSAMVGSAPAASHYFSMGVQPTEAAQFDGSMAAMLRQVQVHLENRDRSFGEMLELMTRQQKSVAEGQQRTIEWLLDRQLQLMKELAESQDQARAVDGDEGAEDEGDRMLETLVGLATRFLPPQGPENH